MYEMWTAYFVEAVVWLYGTDCISVLRAVWEDSEVDSIALLVFLGQDVLYWIW
jgi:hypothetical protein